MKNVSNLIMVATLFVASCSNEKQNQINRQAAIIDSLINLRKTDSLNAIQAKKDHKVLVDSAKKMVLFYEDEHRSHDNSLAYLRTQIQTLQDQLKEAQGFHPFTRQSELQRKIEQCRWDIQSHVNEINEINIEDQQTLAMIRKYQQLSE